MNEEKNKNSLCIILLSLKQCALHAIVVEPFNVDRGEGTIVPGMVEEPYMIKRNDYLSKIARNEYGDWRRWREIYEHNRQLMW